MPFGLIGVLQIANGLGLNKADQNSAWDAITLNEEQIEYASLDAFTVGKLVEQFILP